METRSTDTELSANASTSDQPVAPKPAQTGKLVVLAMLIIGCTYLYFTTPYGGQYMPASRRTDEPTAPLQDQYSKYLKAIEVAKSVSSTDSLQYVQDSIHLNP